MKISNLKKRGARSLGALSCALGATGVLAQVVPQTSAQQADRSSPQMFDQVIVTGDAINEVPWETTTSRQQLEALQVNDMNEFGSRIDPGVNFNETTQSVNIRGLEGTRVVTRIDGIRQSYMDEIRGDVTGGTNAFDFGAIASIDVVRGTDSTAVGSGAFGGMLDVRTLRPHDVINKERGFGVLVNSGYQSVDNSWMLNAAVAAETDLGLRWLVQAGVKQGNARENMATEGGLGALRTQTNPTTYVQQNYLIKLEQSFDGGHEVDLSAAYYDRSRDVTDLTQAPATYVAGQSFIEEANKRQSVALGYSWVSPTGTAWLDRVNAKIYWQEQEMWNAITRDRLTDPKGFYYRKNDMKESTYGIDLSAGKSFFGAISQRWEVGAEYYATKLTQDQIGRDSCPPVGGPFACRFFNNNQADVPETEGKHFGIWLQNAIGFFDDTLTVTPAIRFDDYRYSPQASAAFTSNPSAVSMPSRSGQAWSPKVQIAWQPVDIVTLYAQYAVGFNAPTATQLYTLFGSPGQYLRRGNPNLEAERSRGWELGAKVGNDKLHGALTWFDTYYSKFIEDVNLGATPQYPQGIFWVENLDDVRIYGIEASGHWEFSKGWRTYASLAWTVGKDRSTDTYLNSVAPLKGIVGVSYDAEQWGARLQMTAAAARNNVANETTDFKAPGYGVVDLTAYWKPSQVKGLTVRAGLYNAFNKTYWNALDGSTTASALIRDRYTQPGRNFAVSFTYQY